MTIATRTSAPPAAPDPLIAALEQPDTFHKLVRHAQVLLMPSSATIDAEDVAAEVIKRGWVARHTFDPSVGQPMGWLHGILRNVIQEQGRRERRQPKSLPAEIEIPAPPADDTTCEEFEKLRKYISHLPQQQRELVSWYYLEDLSYTDIATRHGITHATARQRMKRSLDMLRHLMRQEEQS